MFISHLSLSHLHKGRHYAATRDIELLLFSTFNYFFFSDADQTWKADTNFPDPNPSLRSIDTVAPAVTRI